MKKITLLILFLCLVLIVHAQSKITFEDQTIGTSGGTVAVWSGGTTEVVANTYTTGNSSSKALHVQNNGYLGVYFNNVSLAANAATLYSKLTVKYLVIGGTDTNYPTLEIYSAPNSWTMGATEKIGSVGWSGIWGTAEIGVWKTIEFNFSSALLNPTPAGNLILKLVKSNTEYLIDDVELVAVPVATPIVTVNDFESATINDVLTMKRYATTDGTATVESNPTDNTKKSAHIVTTNYDAILKQNVALPSGKTLANYDKIMFDIYLVAGASNNFKKMQIFIDGTKNYEDASYPQQAPDATWTTKEYALSATNGNSFVLDLGISTNAGNYYIDNIKLKEKSVTTATESNFTNPLIIFASTNEFIINQEVSKYELYNLQGKLISSGRNVSKIDHSTFGDGIYILRAWANNDIYTTKLLK